MIVIDKKEDCCGCSACVQICPINCIKMQNDNEGFNYPVVDSKRCLSCGKCIKVCPVINTTQKSIPLKVFAAKNKSSAIRQQSTSGGVFTEVAKFVLSNNGVVYGALFNSKWEVEHDFCDSLDTLADFRSSKYVQSNINSSFIKAQKHLCENRWVLFSGTPCQIHGLNLFLGKRYKKLITVEIVCLGVPSPLVFKKYLSEILRNNQKERLLTDVQTINFRTKNEQWKGTRFTIQLSTKKYLISEGPLKNIYLKGFGAGLYMRPSCYNCPSKGFRSGSDITIGDYWGVDEVIPKFNDKKGVSLVILNTPEGIKIFTDLTITSSETSYSDAYKNNSAIEKSIKQNPKRYELFSEIDGEIIPLIRKLTHKPIPQLYKDWLNSKIFAVKRRFKNVQ